MKSPASERFSKQELNGRAIREIPSKNNNSEIKDLGNRNIIGLNKNNEIILFISGVEVKDIIEDKNKFINRINKHIL